MGEGLFSLYNLHLLEVQPLPRYIAMESGDNLFTFLIEERKILKSRSQNKNFCLAEIVFLGIEKKYIGSVSFWKVKCMVTFF